MGKVFATLNATDRPSPHGSPNYTWRMNVRREALSCVFLGYECSLEVDTRHILLSIGIKTDRKIQYRRSIFQSHHTFEFRSFQFLLTRLCVALSICSAAIPGISPLPLSPARKFSPINVFQSLIPPSCLISSKKGESPMCIYIRTLRTLQSTR